jgi:hypothetical protein
MEKIRRNCPSCNSEITYSGLYFLKRAERKGSLCKKCAVSKIWENDELRIKASNSRKKYLSELSDAEKNIINEKISNTNKKLYERKSDDEKEQWKKLCSETTRERWKDSIFKDELRKKLSDKNWSKREDAKEIKQKQVNSRIEKNNGSYHNGPGRCKEFLVGGLKCYGTAEKKYIEILIENNLDLPKKPTSSIKTKYGTYTPDFEFEDFYVEVKSTFTYDVLMGKSSYSKNEKSNPKQLQKLKHISKNIKPIKICLVDGEIFTYIGI